MYISSRRNLVPITQSKWNDIIVKPKMQIVCLNDANENPQGFPDYLYRFYREYNIRKVFVANFDDFLFWGRGYALIFTSDDMLLVGCRSIEYCNINNEQQVKALFIKAYTFNTQRLRAINASRSGSQRASTGLEAESVLQLHTDSIKTKHSRLTEDDCHVCIPGVEELFNYEPTNFLDVDETEKHLKTLENRQGQHLTASDSLQKSSKSNMTPVVRAEQFYKQLPTRPSPSLQPPTYQQRSHLQSPSIGPIARSHRSTTRSTPYILTHTRISSQHSQIPSSPIHHHTQRLNITQHRSESSIYVPQHQGNMLSLSSPPPYYQQHYTSIGNQNQHSRAASTYIQPLHSPMMPNTTFSTPQQIYVTHRSTHTNHPQSIQPRPRYQLQSNPNASHHSNQTSYNSYYPRNQ